jgi:hypothetical protein
MAYTSDDLQRIRDAIDKGYDFTMCHDVDFMGVVSQLVDDALEGGESLAQSVLGHFPDSRLLMDIIINTKSVHDAVCSGGAEDIAGDLSALIDELEDVAEKMDEAEREASSLL